MFFTNGKIKCQLVKIKLSFLTGPTKLSDPNSKINYLLCLAKYIINMYHIKLVFNENNHIIYHTNVLNRIYLNELSKKLQNDVIYIKKNKFNELYWRDICKIENSKIVINIMN